MSTRHRSAFEILTPEGEFTGELTGRYLYEANESGDYPESGDWVIYMNLPGEDRLMILDRLDRKGIIQRRSPGSNTQSQIAGVNLDLAFIVQGLDGDFNVRRLERYLTTLAEGEVKAAIVLTKADLCEQVSERVQEVQQVAKGIPIHVVSHPTAMGYAALAKYFQFGLTAALLGSSGAGKSTIINHLMGEELQKTGEVRAGDSRGKHTTTARRLLILPEQKGLILDSPGIRELGLWSAQEGLSTTFEDIEALTKLCKFGNCSHQDEPGCAIQEAIQQGEIDARRFSNYQKLERELAFQELKMREGSERAGRLRGRKFARMAKEAGAHKRQNKGKY